MRPIDVHDEFMSDRPMNVAPGGRQPFTEEG
jgi:hypothetical protein